MIREKVNAESECVRAREREHFDCTLSALSRITVP